MRQAAKGLILLAFSLSANSKCMFASVQLDKNISCLFRKAQAGKKRCCKIYVCGRPAEDKRCICSICCARSLQCTSETAADSNRQSRLTDLQVCVTLRSASLCRYRSPSGAKAAEACRLRAPQQKLANTRGREPRPGWLLCFCTESRWKRAGDWVAEYNTNT